MIVFGLSKPVAEVAAAGGRLSGEDGVYKFMGGDWGCGKCPMFLSGVPRG